MNKKNLCVAFAILLMGCVDGPDEVGDGISLGDGSRSDSDRADAGALGRDMGHYLDLGRDTPPVDGPNLNPGQNPLGDGGTQSDTTPANNLDDGLCWYRQECPVGHWRCSNSDGTPVADAQCLTKRNICLCCDVTVPAFSCVGA